jgi:hypothetical protein
MFARKFGNQRLLDIVSRDVLTLPLIAETNVHSSKFQKNIQNASNSSKENQQSKRDAHSRNGSINARTFVRRKDFVQIIATGQLVMERRLENANTNAPLERNAKMFVSSINKSRVI